MNAVLADATRGAHPYDCIFIDGLEVFARHGVYPEENALGQKFVISLRLYTHTRAAGESDDLERSIDYGAVCAFVAKFASEHTFKLIERVAEEVAAAVLAEFPLVERIGVRVEKPWAPIGLPLKTVGVDIERP